MAELLWPSSVGMSYVAELSRDELCMDKLNKDELCVANLSRDELCGTELTSWGRANLLWPSSLRMCWPLLAELKWDELCVAELSRDELCMAELSKDELCVANLSKDELCEAELTSFG